MRRSVSMRRAQITVAGGLAGDGASAGAAVRRVVHLLLAAAGGPAGLTQVAGGAPAAAGEVAAEAAALAPASQTRRRIHHAARAGVALRDTRSLRPRLRRRGGRGRARAAGGGAIGADIADTPALLQRRRRARASSRSPAPSSPAEAFQRVALRLARGHVLPPAAGRRAAARLVALLGPRRSVRDGAAAQRDERTRAVSRVAGNVVLGVALRSRRARVRRAWRGVGFARAHLRVGTRSAGALRLGGTLFAFSRARPEDVVTRAVKASPRRGAVQARRAPRFEVHAVAAVARDRSSGVPRRRDESRIVCVFIVPP
mmetsp:Transcript_8504/g.35542  ORF Transcript_8504/g.35542 Transcript_8504/m.35542 type:complete len:314 (-) Transcript_8504:721-1662(-)